MGAAWEVPSSQCGQVSICFPRQGKHHIGMQQAPDTAFKFHAKIVEDGKGRRHHVS